MTQIKMNNGDIPMHHLLPGTVLNGKYIIQSVIGEGGFGITYKAKYIDDDSEIAVKEYYPFGYVNRSNYVSNEVSTNVTQEREELFFASKNRFIREAEILSRFSDAPGIVKILDYFEENNTAYIVMEYLEGMTMLRYVRENGPMSIEKAAELTMPIMELLSNLHKNDVIHRDISPDNIMICDDCAKLIDFGMACPISTYSASVALKPGYAPEEQYRKKGELGSWTDVYSLCATIYKCITGITPEDSISRMVEDKIKKPSEVGVEINSEIENVIMRGMGVTKMQRIEKFDEILEVFERFF